MLREIKEKIPLLKKTLINYNNIGVITHKNADPDAIASVIALREILLKKMNANIKTFFPEGINSLSKRITESLGIDIPEQDNIEGVELFIVTDTSSSTQLGKYLEYVTSKDIIIVDHHEGGDLSGKALLEIKTTNTSSSSEIVYILGRELGIEFDIRVLELLMAGIIFDSKRFILAKPVTFNIVAELISRGVDYPKIIKLFNIRPELSERIARIKASLRARHFRIKNIIVTLTEVGAFEASVARSLVELGSDLVLVVNQVGKNEVRLTARASQYFVEETKIHVGKDVLAKLSEYFGGSGGGHSTAGGYTGYNTTAENVLDKALDILVALLEEKGYASKEDLKGIGRD